MSSTPGTPALAPFRVRSFRFQWPADLATSWAFEMETLILGWYILVETQSVFLLTVFAFGYPVTATLYCLFALAFILLIVVHWRAHLWRLDAPANAR